jgi:hypothetical protein
MQIQEKQEILSVGVPERIVDEEHFPFCILLRALLCVFAVRNLKNF